MPRFHSFVRLFLLAWLPCMYSVQALAADVTIGMRAEQQSMDPHYLWGFTNSQNYYHFLGYMVRIQPDGSLAPSIATEWSPEGDKGWLFKLNPNARFSNGDPITPEDVIASYRRAMNYPGGGLRGLFALIADFEVVDPHTLRIVTKRPDPYMPYKLTQVAVIPKSIAEKAQGKDFLLPADQVSGGPYEIVRYQPGAELVLKANPYYWEKPRWDHVTIKYIPNDSARVAALMTGAVDVIDGVQPDDAAEIDKKDNLHTVSGPGSRMIYFNMDQSRAITPDVTDNDGKPLAKNPFQDLRIRQAIAYAIDRQGIVSHVMHGKGGVLTQMGVKGQGGYDPDMPKIPYDPDQSRKLLKEAGYPDGFRMKITCPSGYLVNDSLICQAVGQMLARVGIKTAVDVMPWSVLVTRVTCHCDRRPSFFMAPWSNAYLGEVGAALSNLLHSYDKKTGAGGWNQGEFPSTPELDALIDEAATTIDAEKRHALQKKAMRMAMAEMPVIPLHYQAVTLASRKNLTPSPYTIEYTIAESINVSKE